MNTKKFWKFFKIFTIGILALYLLLFIVIIPFNGLYEKKDLEVLDAYEGGRKNVLILGTDASESRSDVLLIVSFPEGKGTINITSIPRDTRMQTSNGGMKINSALSIGGEELTITKIKEITSIPIHDYITVNFNAVKDVVNILGGVKFDVPQDMDYEDPYQDLYIHLKAGEQRLNGDEAVQLLRFRGYPMADIQRTQVQRDFMKAAIDQKLNVKYIFTAPVAIGAVAKNMTTSIGSTEILAYALKAASNSEFNTVELPYSLRSPYVIITPDSAASVVEENFK